jgi:hypothetical protein
MAAPAAKAAPPKTDEWDEDTFDPRNINNLMSNNVLEWEAAEVEKEIAGLRAKRQEVPDELLSRKQIVEVKMQGLIIGVQTGKITMEAYAELVQQKIKDERELAKMLLGKGRKVRPSFDPRRTGPRWHCSGPRSWSRSWQPQTKSK